MPKYCYSLTNETYHGNYNTEAAAIQAGNDAAYDDAYDYIDTDGEGPYTFYIGELKPAAEYLPPMHYWIGVHIVEHIAEQLADEIYYEDGYILTLAKDEQHEELGKLICDWLITNATFNCDGVTNIRQITINSQGTNNA
jgi:hypothetical protein